MSDQKYIDRMTGYKATDANMVCKGSKFELGVWYEIEGDIALCYGCFPIALFKLRLLTSIDSSASQESPRRN